MTRALAPISGPSDGQPSEMDSALWSTRLETARASSEAQRVDVDAAMTGKPKGATGPVVDPKEIEKLQKVSQDFESIFLSYMMKVGRESGLQGHFMGHSEGEQIFTEMRDDELAKHMSKAGGIGLAKLLVEQMTRVLQQQAQKRAVEPTEG